MAMMWKTWNTYTLMVGMWNGAVTSENSLANSQKVKHRFTVWPGNYTPRYIPNRTENMCFYKTFTQIFIAALFTIAQY